VKSLSERIIEIEEEIKFRKKLKDYLSVEYLAKILCQLRKKNISEISLN
jgi:hypothetical protein